MSSKRLCSSAAGSGWPSDALASDFRTTGASVGAGTTNVVGDGSAGTELSGVAEAGTAGEGDADGETHAAVNAISRMKLARDLTR